MLTMVSSTPPILPHAETLPVLYSAEKTARPRPGVQPYALSDSFVSSRDKGRPSFSSLRKCADAKHEGQAEGHGLQCSCESSRCSQFRRAVFAKDDSVVAGGGRVKTASQGPDVQISSSSQSSRSQSQHHDALDAVSAVAEVVLHRNHHISQRSPVQADPIHTPEVTRAARCAPCGVAWGLHLVWVVLL